MLYGDLDWTLYTIELPAGQHTVKWCYYTAQTGNVEEYVCWVDDITFPGNTVILDFSKSANTCATLTLPSPLLNTLLVSSNWPFPMFTLSELYLMAPKRELPIVIFATISPLPPLPMPQSAVPAPSSGGSLTPDDRARPLPFSRKSGCAVPSPPDCS